MPKRKADSADTRPLKKTKKAFTAAKSAAALVNKMLLAKMEKKFHIVGAAPISISTAGQIEDLSAVTQGPSEAQRIGDKLLPKYITINFQVVLADTTNLMQVILLRWKPDDAIDTITFAKVNNGGNLAPIAMYNWNMRDKFDILKSEIFSLDAGNPSQFRRWFVSFGDKTSQMKYNISATSGCNKFFLVICSDSQATTHPTFTYYSRLVFTDS